MQSKDFFSGFHWLSDSACRTLKIHLFPNIIMFKVILEVPNFEHLNSSVHVSIYLYNGYKPIHTFIHTYITLHYITLIYFTLLSLLCSPLHDMTWHYITLHCIHTHTYIHMYIRVDVATDPFGGTPPFWLCIHRVPCFWLMVLWFLTASKSRSLRLGLSDRIRSFIGDSFFFFLIARHFVCYEVWASSPKSWVEMLII